MGVGADEATMEPDRPTRADATPEVVLATNAPAGWPSIRAPRRAAAGGTAADHVAAIARRVADGLRDAGLTVVEEGRSVLLGQQIVRIDLVVVEDGGETPVFVFPGVDTEREGAMFAFLGAALREVEAFPRPPVYFGVAPLGSGFAPTRTMIEARAERFLARAVEQGVPLAMDASGDEVVAAVRALAPAAVEAGGGDTVAEAACFVGEWLRRCKDGQWVLREDLPRTVLVVADLDATTQWHLPLFAWFPDAVRTGYDGLGDLLREVLGGAGVAERLPLSSHAYRREAVTWLEGALPRIGPRGEATGVLRRCAACGEMTRGEIEAESPAVTVERAIARLLAIANLPRTPCRACGGADYREIAVVHTMPVDDVRVAIVAEFMDSHMRVATRELAPA